MVPVAIGFCVESLAKVSTTSPETVGVNDATRPCAANGASVGVDEALLPPPPHAVKNVTVATAVARSLKCLMVFTIEFLVEWLLKFEYTCLWCGY